MERSGRRYLPPGFTCPKCDGTTFEKEMNIVDIWFESGVTHLAVLARRHAVAERSVCSKAAINIAAGSAVRSLPRVAIKGAAPYKHVVKNGWVNDEQGRAMSKSTGTGIDARDAMDKWGADVLRLWAASVEFVDDVRFGPNVVEQVGRVYRNVRNRIRFMISNLDDLGAADRRSARCDAAARCGRLQRGRRVHRRRQTPLRAFGIHDAYLRIIEFESAMSSLYFDALKDPLYSLGENDPRRRSAQSALLYVLKRFLTAIAPVLSFTAEEAWQEIPASLRDGEASVFDSVALRARHQRRGARSPTSNCGNSYGSCVHASLRVSRRITGTIRDYETSATVVVPQRFVAQLEALGDNLREALVVSQLNGIESTGDDGRVDVRLERAHGEKCRRCWKFRELGVDPQHPSICEDCAKVVRAL